MTEPVYRGAPRHRRRNPERRTKDKNIGFTADFLAERGIDLREVRVVPDVMDEIVARSTRCGIAIPMSSPRAASGRRMMISPPMRLVPPSACRWSKTHAR